MTNAGDLIAGLFHAVPYMFMADFMRYAVWAGGTFLVINGLMSGVLAGRRIRARALRKGQITRELLTSLRSVIIYTIFSMLIYVGQRMGITRFYGDPALHRWVWFSLSIPLLIILQDAWFYWTHRLVHQPRYFRKWHRTHHKSNVPTPLTAYAFDWREAIVHAIYVVGIGMVLPISYLAIIIFMTHMIIRDAIGHCGYELFPRNAQNRPLFDWMTTVTHHDMHHAQGGYNFGLYFTFWDRVMGTEHPEYYAQFAKSVSKEVFGGMPKPSKLRPETQNPAHPTGNQAGTLAPVN